MMSAPQRYRTSVHLFTVAVWAGTAALFVVSSRYPSDVSLGDFLLFCALAAFAENWDVPISSNSRMSLSFTVHLSAGILFGPLVAAAVAGVGIIATDGLVHRAGPTYVAFNVAQMASATMLASISYLALGGSATVDLLHDALPIAVASLVYLLVNNTLVTIALALTGRSFRQEWIESSRDIMLPYVSMGPLGALVAHTYVSTPWSIFYFVPLVLVIYNGFRLFVSLQHETDHALVALADSIDKRDQYTYQHSMRVARLCGEIAEAMSLTPRDTELLVAAARVHDLGKIATDNRVLFKQSSLTADERDLIKAHPAEGGELAGRFSMFRQGRRFIRHHHERYDGKGYPDGIAGEDIPLGARIITVADSYDAMTSDRPYRKALPHEVALIELERGAGTQFDPAVVQAFLSRERSHATERVPLTVEARESCSY
jgi:putative nucleotidyltransferase with HDIG domain